MPRRDQEPQTTSNTAGRVTVKRVTPRRDFKRDDFFRDLKKVARKQDRPSQPESKTR